MDPTNFERVLLSILAMNFSQSFLINSQNDKFSATYKGISNNT